MDRQVTPPKQVTPPTWGSPPPCKQALNVDKTTKGLISKSNFARAAHFFCTFLCRCFARLQRETSRNFLGPVYMEGRDPR